MRAHGALSAVTSKKLLKDSEFRMVQIYTGEVQWLLGNKSFGQDRKAAFP